MATDTRVVLCTVPSAEVGVRMAHSLLDERLAACVNLLPQVRSLYRWKGEIQDDQELLLLIKTQQDRYQALEQRLRDLHPYEVCEVLTLEVKDGSHPYLDWVMQETRPLG